MSKLFTPLQVGAVEVRNRLWMSPMCQFSALGDGPGAGLPNDWHFVHYAARSQGGVGAVLVEATAVSERGRITPFDLLLDSDEKIPAFARLAYLIAEGGATPGIQLAHAGRKASCSPGGHPLAPAEGPLGGIGWVPVAPSPLPFTPAHTQPLAPAEAEIAGLVDLFVQAARRAVLAGFRLVEIHAAHGYLLHQFLSPLTNQRSDAFGGDFAARAQVLRLIVRAVRAVIGPQIGLLVRLSATDWVHENPGDQRSSTTLEEMGTLAQWLGEDGADLLDISTGGLLPDAQIVEEPHYQVPFSQEINRLSGMPVSAVGLITEAEAAEKLVTQAGIEVVFLGRPLLTDPSLAYAWAGRLGDQAPIPPQYSSGTPRQ